LLNVHCASPIDDCAIFGYSLHCHIKRAVVERILFYLLLCVFTVSVVSNYIQSFIIFMFTMIWKIYVLLKWLLSFLVSIMLVIINDSAFQN